MRSKSSPSQICDSQLDSNKNGTVAGTYNIMNISTQLFTGITQIIGAVKSDLSILCHLTFPSFTLSIQRFH